MPDAIQEFSIETSNYSAQYGQNAGGVVNIITKHGTNQYHGDAFEFVRNRDFNAANAFTYNAALGHKIVDTVNRNQFGGTVGGPLEIPHLFHSGRSFGFFGYQRTINHSASTAGSSTILLPNIAQAGARLLGRRAGHKHNLVFAGCVSNPFDPSGTTYMVADASCTNQVAIRYFPHLEGRSPESGHTELPEIRSGVDCEWHPAPVQTAEQLRSGRDHGAGGPGIGRE